MLIHEGGFCGEGYKVRLPIGWVFSFVVLAACASCLQHDCLLMKSRSQETRQNPLIALPVETIGSIQFGYFSRIGGYHLCECGKPLCKWCHNIVPYSIVKRVYGSITNRDDLIGIYLRLQRKNDQSVSFLEQTPPAGYLMINDLTGKEVAVVTVFRGPVSVLDDASIYRERQILRIRDGSYGTRDWGGIECQDDPDLCTYLLEMQRKYCGDICITNDPMIAHLEAERYLELFKSGYITQDHLMTYVDDPEASGIGANTNVGTITIFGTERKTGFFR